MTIICRLLADSMLIAALWGEMAWDGGDAPQLALANCQRPIYNSINFPARELSAQFHPHKTEPPKK